MTADLSAVPETLWMSEPLVCQPPSGVLPPEEVFAQAQSFSAAPTPLVDLRRTNFVGLTTAPAPRTATEAALLKSLDFSLGVESAWSLNCPVVWLSVVCLHTAVAVNIVQQSG